MAPPCYADLGKSARDLFSKGYNYGFLKIDSTTKSKTLGEHPLEFKTSTSHNTATGKLFGCVDLKYKFPKYGITLTEKWNTENVLGTEVVVEDQGMDGLKVTFDSTFNPHLSKRTGKLKAALKNDKFHLNTDVGLDSTKPIIAGAGVFEYNGILVGVQGAYNTSTAKLANTSLGIGYKTGEYALHTFVNDNTEFGGNLYHQVNRRLQLAANVGWNANDSTTRFGVASKYELEKGTTIQGKVSSNSEVGVALIHNLSDHLKVTFSGMCKLENFAEGAHKFGCGLEYTQ